MADRNGERLATLINDLLDFEKLSIGNLPISLTRLALGEFLQQQVTDLAPYAARHNIELRLEAEDHLADVRASTDRLTQVLSNLISNAVKFSPAGKQVRIKASRAEQHVRIEVIDQGPGIPEEWHSKVFEKFWQADSSSRRRHPGTGLGLAITKLLVERMGGRIGFQSSSQGSVFFVDLPMFASPLD